MVIERPCGCPANGSPHVPHYTWKGSTLWPQPIAIRQLRDGSWYIKLLPGVWCEVDSDGYGRRLGGLEVR